MRLVDICALEAEQQLTGQAANKYHKEQAWLILPQMASDTGIPSVWNATDSCSDKYSIRGEDGCVFPNHQEPRWPPCTSDVGESYQISSQNEHVRLHRLLVAESQN